MSTEDIKTNLILNELTEEQLNEQTLLPPNQLWLTPDDCDEEIPTIVGPFQKVLWTNNAPNTSFASQTITFEAFNWDYILLLFMLSVGNQRCGSVVFSKSVYGSAIGYPNTNTSGADNAIRNLNITSNTSITFEDCYRSIGTGSETVANNYCIPYQIVGIKTNTVPTDYINLDNIERVETVYDMTSLNSSLNWGLTSGIMGGVSVSDKNFMKYKYLKIYPKYSSGFGQPYVINLEYMAPSTNVPSNVYCGNDSTIIIGDVLGGESVAIGFSLSQVNAEKTSFSHNKIGYLVNSQYFPCNNDNGYLIYKIEGVY